jgi:transposase
MVQEKQKCGQRVLGADVALEKFDAGIAVPDSLDDLRSIKVRAFPRTLEGVKACVAWVQGQGGVDSVVMEATGYYSRELAGWFRAVCPNLPVFIVNPFLIKRFGESLGVRTKTDAQDARVIACYGVGRRLWLPHEKSGPLQELHRLHKDRTALVNMLKCERLRAKGADRTPVAIAVHESLCSELEKGVETLDKAIADVVKAQKPLTNDVKLLQSIPGVGHQTATLVMGALGDLRRFATSRQLAAFVGVSPRQKDSGKSVHGRAVLCKKGSPQVRAALFLASMAAIRSPGPLRSVYLGLIDRGKAKMAALGAIMRRLLILMRAVLVTGATYNPEKHLQVLAKTK